MNKDEDLETAAKRWLSLVNKNIKKCFKKIRIKKERRNKELDELFTKKEDLKVQLCQTDDDNPLKDVIEENLENVIEEISVLCGQKNKEIAEEYLGKVRDPLDGFNQAGTWSLKKKLAPKSTIQPPMAKKDSHGN